MHLPAVAKWGQWQGSLLEAGGIESTNNAIKRALRKAVIQRKINLGVQFRQGTVCSSCLLTVSLPTEE